MSKQRKKITAAEWRAALRRGRSKPREVRQKIAREIGASFSSFERNRRGVKKEGWSFLKRQSRSDRGSTRRLSPRWVRLICAAYFIEAPTTFREVHRRLVRTCARRNRFPGSYSWVRRQINGMFVRALASNRRLAHLGDFVRTRPVRAAEAGPITPTTERGKETRAV